MGYCGLPLVFVHDGWSIIFVRIQHHMPLASNSKQPIFAVYAWTHATVREFCTKLCSDIQKFVPNFHRIAFCHSKFCKFRIPPPPPACQYPSEFSPLLQSDTHILCLLIAHCITDSLTVSDGLTRPSQT